MVVRFHVISVLCNAELCSFFVLRCCQIAEMCDWQLQHDADSGDQKVEPGSAPVVT